MFNKIIIKFILFISNKDDYCAVQPPSTNMLDPVIKDDASDARNTNGSHKISDLTQSLEWYLRNHFFFKILIFKKPFVIGVFIKVGQTVLTLIPYFANSKDNALVNPSIANFVVQYVVLLIAPT